MVAITSQAHAAAARDLPFCYVCGQSFRADDEINRDHVPPSAIFESEDRDYPLLLPTHVICNSDQSENDQEIGHVFRLLRGETYQPRRGKLPIQPMPNVAPGAVGLQDFDLPRIIRRWIRGFHAALYREPVADIRNFGTIASLPRGSSDGRMIEPIPEVYFKYVEELKRNRATNSLDQIECRGSKCRFEVVWARADDGRWIAIYALDLYGWIDAGAFPDIEKRGCVGNYWRPDFSKPSLAAGSTSLEFSIANHDPNDPFGS